MKQKGLCAVARRKNSLGFTVIELLISVIVAAITLAIAVPSLLQLSANNQVRSTTTAIVDGLNLARHSAITTGDTVTICSTSNGSSCSDETWDAGWIVFNDIDDDDAVDSDEIIRVLMHESTTDISGFEADIEFLADGTTTLNADASFVSCHDNANSGKCRNVSISTFGKIESSVYEEEDPSEGGETS